jgi:hypothetical protein
VTDRPPWHLGWPVDRWLRFSTAARWAAVGCDTISRRFAAWRYDRPLYRWDDARNLAMLATANIASALAWEAGRDEYRRDVPVVTFPVRREPESRGLTR